MHALGTINSAQSSALARLVHELHPTWDVPGIAAAISRAKHRGTIEELCVAAVRLAMRDDLRNPAVLAEDGPHWRNPQTSTAVVSAHAERCPEPGHGSYFAWNCGACKADAAAADDDRAGVLIRQGIPRAEVRRILAAHGVTPDARTAAAGGDR